MLCDCLVTCQRQRLHVRGAAWLSGSFERPDPAAHNGDPIQLGSVRFGSVTVTLVRTSRRV